MRYTTEELKKMQAILVDGINPFNQPSTNAAISVAFALLDEVKRMNESHSEELE
jgi:glucose-6-phosphate isomerase|tara:strand:+ start:617 stop:778 length:162 start_codon:yes stop_codon:yes gene_type:complete